MRGTPAWGCSGENCYVQGVLQPWVFVRQRIWRRSHFFILRPLEFLSVSLELFDSYSSRTRWMRWLMTSPWFFSLVITLLSISDVCPLFFRFPFDYLHCYLPSGWPSVSSFFLSPLIPSMPVLKYGTDAVLSASAKIWSHCLVTLTFSFRRLWPILLKKKKMVAHHKSPATFSGLPKYPVFL